MNPDPDALAVATKKPAGLSRKLLPVLAGLALLAAGANLYRWFDKPALEPLPIAATEKMSPPIRELIQAATAEVKRQERSAAAWGDLGAVYFAHRITPEAAVCFRNAERLDAGDYRWPYLLGVNLVYLDVDRSLDAFRRAAKRCGEQAHVQLQLAETLLDRGELEEAEVQIDMVLTYASSNPRAQFAKGRLLLAQGKHEAARPWAEQSAAAAPDMRAPHLLMAQLCHRAHDAAGETRALAALGKIRDRYTTWEDPDIAAIAPLCQDRTARLKRAQQLAKSGQTAALQGTLYEMAEGGDGASAVGELAWLLDTEGKFRESEALLRHHLPDSPNDERFHFLVGVACFNQDKYAEAEAEFRRAIELKPDYSQAWYNLGLTLLKLDQQGGARDAFAAVVRLSPSQVLARINLAELLLEEGKQEQAREHLEAALQLAPDDQYALRLLAKAKAQGK